MTESEREIARLRQWKAEATEVLLGLQDLGAALRLPLGERITAQVAAEAARRWMAIAEGAVALGFDGSREVSPSLIQLPRGDGPMSVTPIQMTTSEEVIRTTLAIVLTRTPRRIRGRVIAERVMQAILDDAVDALREVANRNTCAGCGSRPDGPIDGDGKRWCADCYATAEGGA